MDVRYAFAVGMVVLLLVSAGCGGDGGTSTGASKDIPVIEGVTAVNNEETSAGEETTDPVNEPARAEIISSKDGIIEYRWKGDVYKADDSSDWPVFRDFNWIDENLPKDAIILSWWDYGHGIRLHASRETLISDPCPTEACMETIHPDYRDTIVQHSPEEKVLDVATFFTSGEDEAYSIAKKYGVDYVLITIEEMAKSSAIYHHMGKDIGIASFDHEKTGDEAKDRKSIEEGLAGKRIFYTMDYGDMYKVWYPQDESQMAESMLVKLLPFNTDRELEHFKHVIDNGYVYLYEVV